MKLKILTSMAGNNFALSPGDVTGMFSDAEALRLISAGFAEAVEEIERAVDKAPTVKRKARK